MHRLGSRIRHSPSLEKQQWLWRTIEPFWQKVFQRLTARRGFAATINGDVFQLNYQYGSRYDRADQRSYEPYSYLPFVERIQAVVSDLSGRATFHTSGTSMAASLRRETWKS